MWTEGGRCGDREQVGVKFFHVNIQGTIKSEGSSDGGYNPVENVVKVIVYWMLDINVSTQI